MVQCDSSLAVCSDDHMQGRRQDSAMQGQTRWSGDGSQRQREPWWGSGAKLPVATDSSQNRT